MAVYTRKRPDSILREAMRFKPERLTKCFLTKPKFYSSGICDKHFSELKTDKYDNESRQDKKQKVIMIKYIDDCEYTKKDCGELNCQENTTHGVYGLQVESINMKVSLDT